MQKSCHINKLAIIGAGRVGTSFAYAAMIKKIASEIVLIDLDKNKAKGESMDLNHGISYIETINVYDGDYNDCRNADYIVITSGASQKPGENRINLVQRNVEILKNILPKILKYNTNAKIILVTNPVDILTFLTLKISGLPKNQVFGSGTSLDTSRFRYLLGKYFKVSPDSVDAYIIGEHGDSEVAVFQNAQIAGIPLKNFKNYSKEKMHEIYLKTKNAAYEVIKYKGSTHYAIGLVLTDIIEAMMYNQHKVIPVSTVLNGEFGIKNIALSLPCVIAANGIEKVLEISLSKNELNLLKKSAETLKSVIKTLKI
ncbi:MAG: L-lactate dehydrogenase [Candidatus Woesearchaeota archaeon]|jgi:L-lactate dehydrogenase